MASEKQKEALGRCEWLVFYLVMNSDGQFFRRKGYGGYTETWTDDLERATIYTKIGTARGRVSFFANHYPQYPVPLLVEVRAGAIQVLHEEERVAKSGERKRKEEAARDVRRRKHEVASAQRALDEARKKLGELGVS